MKKMLLSAILMGMLALGITTSTEASPHHHNPHSGFHAVHHPPMHGPRPGKFGPRPGKFGPRPGKFGPRPGEFGPRPGEFGPRPGTRPGSFDFYRRH